MLDTASGRKVFEQAASGASSALSKDGSKVVTGGGGGRYPRADLPVLDDPASADVVLLPDEPYVFTDTDGPEAFSRVPTQLVSGRLLTWYGPSLPQARISFDRT